MHIEKNTQDPDLLNMRLDVDEAEVVMSMATERIRVRLLEGREPVELDEQLSDAIAADRAVCLTGNELAVHYIRSALNLYAVRSVTEARSIQESMGEDPDAVGMAMDRFDLGIRAQQMVVDIESEGFWAPTSNL